MHGAALRLALADRLRFTIQLGAVERINQFVVGGRNREGRNAHMPPSFVKMTVSGGVGANQPRRKLAAPPANVLQQLLKALPGRANITDKTGGMLLAGFAINPGPPFGGWSGEAC